MIKKIISGGQTGADQAALDAAIKWNIPHGGWVPSGRLTEAGRLPDIYKMKEMPTDSNPARTEQNVIDSDGTLIISHGPLTEGSKHTKEIAFKRGKPYLHIDLNKINLSIAARQVYDWIIKSEIETLNVAGPRASSDPSIYQAVMHLMTVILIMDSIKIKMSSPIKSTSSKTATLEKAVNMVIAKMSLRDRCYIANMAETELSYLDITLGAYIRKSFGIEAGYEELIKACKKISGKIEINDMDISSILISELWKKLRETHTLRILK
jgi:hypothetical protein